MDFLFSRSKKRHVHLLSETPLDLKNKLKIFVKNTVSLVDTLKKCKGKQASTSSGLLPVFFPSFVSVKTTKSLGHPSFFWLALSLFATSVFVVFTRRRWVVPNSGKKWQAGRERLNSSLMSWLLPPVLLSPVLLCFHHKCSYCLNSTKICNVSKTL